jgi:hypothetical protein
MWMNVISSVQQTGHRPESKLVFEKLTGRASILVNRISRMAAAAQKQ